MPKIKYVLITLACLLLKPADAWSTSANTVHTASADTKANVEEAEKEINNTQEGNSQPDTASSTIQSTIQCHPKEGPITFDFKKNTAFIEGGAHVEYSTTKIDAEDMLFNWAQRAITVWGKKNEQGIIDQKAILTLDKKEYIANTIHYHLDSQRSVATALFTKQDDGLLRSDRVKKDRENIFYGNNGIYTTCNLTHPHFYIATDQVKLVQDNKIVSGPFRLYFDGVRTPLGLPFGVFLLPRESGIIAPEYAGFDTDKGFGLTDGGYYFHFNDYIDLTLQGDIYSRLTASLRGDLRYKQRYRYSGNLFYQGNWERHTESHQKGWKFKWKHNTENNRISSLNADVEIASTSFKDFHAAHNKKTNRQSSNSTIHYANTLVGLPHKLDAKLRYNYHTRGQEKTRQEEATLPELYLKTNKIYPLRKRRGVSNTWYSDIYFEHRFDFKNKLSNNEKAESLTFFSPKDWQELVKNKEYAAQHKVPLGTHIKLFNYISFTPKISYIERWYGEKYLYIQRGYSLEKARKQPGFFRVPSYNLEGSLETILYGTYVFSSKSFLQAIRHEVQPSFKFVYTPDFSKGPYEYFQTLPNGNQQYRFSKIYGALENRATACLTASLNNSLTAKIKRNDKGEAKTEKIPILRSFDWSASYDFLKEQHHLSDITFKAGTRALKDLVTLSLNTTFDPYLYEYEQKTIYGRNKKIYEKREDFAWNHGQGVPYIGNMQSTTLNVGCRFGPLRRSGFLSLFQEKDKSQKKNEQNKDDSESKTVDYQQFTLPWGIGLDYKLDYKGPTHKQWEYRSAKDTPSMTQGVDMSGEFKLTEHWKIGIRSKYDITKRRWCYENTHFDIKRDLHCWNMEFECQPWGENEYYKFKINVTSSSLQFMRYSRERRY